MTIYRFAQVFAFVGVLLWLIRAAVDLHRVVVHQNGSTRARAQFSKWGEEVVAKKSGQPSTSDHRSLRHLFLH
jgi:hypothetical protein